MEPFFNRPPNAPPEGLLASSLWQVPAYLPFIQPELTETMIRAAEGAIGYPLPPEYLKLLRQQNGGYLRVRLPEMTHDVISGIGSRYPYLYRPDWSELAAEVSFPLEGLVPFDGDGHWHLCFDYRAHPENPSITFIDLEGDSQEVIAPNFHGYLRKLVLPVEEGEFVVLAAEGIQELTQRLARILKVAFEAPDSDDLGYPIYRARVGRGQIPEWIWVSPNVVPKGFVRKDDDEFEELRDSMPGWAKRYPELSEDSCLVTITEGAAPSVIEGLTSAAVEMMPLKTALPS